jgi:hypothetical protein
VAAPRRCPCVGTQGSPFTHALLGFEVFYSASLLRQAYHSFEFRSFSIRTSRERSATIFFSSAFSRSSSFTSRGMRRMRQGDEFGGVATATP